MNQTPEQKFDFQKTLEITASEVELAVANCPITNEPKVFYHCTKTIIEGLEYFKLPEETIYKLFSGIEVWLNNITDENITLIYNYEFMLRLAGILREFIKEKSFYKEKDLEVKTKIIISRITNKLIRILEPQITITENDLQVLKQQRELRKSTDDTLSSDLEISKKLMTFRPIVSCAKKLQTLINTSALENVAA